jgi:hypothetical protein
MNPYTLPANLPWIKKVYPGWGTLVEKMTDRRLKAQDLKRILGISYRQLNDWEKERGILKSRSTGQPPEKGSSWRRFSILDLIILSIITEAKKRSIPVTKLQNAMGDIYLSEFMVFDAFPGVVYGLELFFVTDLEDSFDYWCPERIEPMVKIPILKPRGIQTLLIIPMSPIIDHVFETLGHRDFEVIKKSEGGYSFKINGVPLALEDLPKKENPHEVEK